MFFARIAIRAWFNAMSKRRCVVIVMTTLSVRGLGPCQIVGAWFFAQKVRSVRGSGPCQTVGAWFFSPKTASVRGSSHTDGLSGLKKHAPTRGAIQHHAPTQAKSQHHASEGECMEAASPTDTSDYKNQRPGQNRGRRQNQQSPMSQTKTRD